MMSNIAVLTWESWINPESCTPKREITLVNLKEKQCRGNTLYMGIIPINRYTKGGKFAYFVDFLSTNQNRKE